MAQVKHHYCDGQLYWKIIDFRGVSLGWYCLGSTKVASESSGLIQFKWSKQLGWLLMYILPFLL